MAGWILADDGAHQVHDRGEQQGAGVLPLGGLLEEGVDRLGGEGVLQGGTGHDGDGALLGEPLEDVVEDHGAASLECRYLPVWRHFTRPITPPSKPWSGLTLHPEKTRLVPFQGRPPGSPRAPATEPPGTFDFLGFTHYWGRTLKGNWAVKRKTAKDRFRRSLRSMAGWCREHRHLPIKEQ